MEKEHISRMIDNTLRYLHLPPVIDLEFEIPKYINPYGNMFPLESNNKWRINAYVFVDKYDTEGLVDVIQNPQRCVTYDFFNNNKGEAALAEYLASNEHTEEEKKLCMLYALLSDLCRGHKLPTCWCGPVFTICNEMLKEVCKRFKGQDVFHHAMRSKVPISVDMNKEPDIEDIPIILQNALNSLNEEYMLAHFHSKQEELEEDMERD